MVVAITDKYHTDKYAIENVAPDGTRIRVMEIFGENAARATLKTINDHWKINPELGICAEMRQVRDEKGFLE